MGVAAPGVGVGGGGVGLAALADCVAAPNATTIRTTSANTDTDFFSIQPPSYEKNGESKIIIARLYLEVNKFDLLHRFT
jgi:hypothetical protein